MILVMRTRKAARLFALILACCAATARAQEAGATYEDWQFAADATLATASTTNEDGEAFGIVCSPDCITYIASEMPCSPEDTYEGTMESAIGVEPVRFTCRVVEERFTLLFTPAETLIDASVGAEDLTFRVLLDDGNRAFRFSLRGAFQALYAALERATALAQRSTT
jgi:hypothetical protein